MNHLYDRWVRRIAASRRRPPQPDFTGWTDEQVLLWAARHGQYEAIVEKANEGPRPEMVRPERREADLEAAGEWSASRTDDPPQRTPDERPAQASAPAQPEREAEYWEEKCHWRHRGLADIEPDSGGYEVEHDYDPLADA